MPVSYVSSDTIALRHGFFTREGGVSPAPYKSLNVTTRVGDSAENVATNRKRALNALKLKPENLAYLDDMEHSDRILAVTKAARGLDFDGYDAIMTNQAEVVLGMSVADCAVVLLVSEQDGAIALAHSGWRGTRANVVPKVIEAMQEEYGVETAHLKAVIGPSVSVRTYEVGSEVADEFDDRYVEKSEDSCHLDLKLAIEDQLVESGVKNIDIIPVDTIEDERFFSYRRANGDTGRFFAVASL